jgi:DNA recombination protein RmuC
MRGHDRNTISSVQQILVDFQGALEEIMLTNLLLAFAAFAAGCLLTSLLLHSRVAVLIERIASRDTELDQLRETIASSTSESDNLRARLQSESELRSTAEAKLSHVQTEATLLRENAVALQDRIVCLSSELAESETKRYAERTSLEEKLALLNDARQELSLQFKNLANEVLEDKSKKFTEQNKLNIDSLLTPLRDQINLFRQKVEETYDKESQQRASLRDAVENLSGLNKKMNEEAINLTNALKGQSKTLGNWGEFVLEEILQKAGLVKDREYSIRETLVGQDGRRSQPDVIINLPENRQLIVDSKVNLSAYLRHTSAENEADSESELRAHISAMRVHLKEMDRKSYQDHYKLNSLDFVLMFVPLEPAFIVAVRRDPTLFDDAFAKRIVIVCPSTLLATMRTVRNIWRQEDQKRNVLEIAKQSGALYDKFVGFVEDLNDIGVKLQQTQNSYDAAHNKLTSGKGNLVNRAERILHLGAKASKRIPLSLVETSLGDEASERGLDEFEGSSLPIVALEDGELFSNPVSVESDSLDEGNFPLLKSQNANAGEI